jgi:WD40 repeat protein
MIQDLEVLERARLETKATLPEDYRRELVSHGAILRALGVETLGKEDFNTLMDLATDLRAKAEYAKHGSDTRRLQVSKAPVYHLALTADGKQLTAPDDSLLKSWDVATGRVVWDVRLSERGRVSALTAVLEGRLFAGTQEGTISLLSADTGKVLSRSARAGPKLDWLAASPLGDKFVVGHKDGSLDLWRVSDFTSHTSLLKDLDRQPQASFSPDGKWLCVPTPKKGVTVLRIGAEREEKILPVERGDVAVARFTPDSRRICAVSRDGHITVWNWPEGKVVRSWDGRQPLTWDAAVSVDGKYLATASGDRNQAGEVKLWDLERGEEFKTLRFSSAANVVAFSADGKRLAIGYYDGSSRVVSDWSSPYSQNPWRLIPVKVRTFRGGKEVNGYEVFYVSIGHLNDPPPYPRLRGVSSPANGEIPAGKRYLWATNGTHSSPKTLFTINDQSDDPYDLVIP